YAAGVQFHPVEYNGKTYYPGQANNFYIFPAIGMSVLVTQAKMVNDAMFIEAAHAIADEVSTDQLSVGSLYPLQANILGAELRAAERIAKNIFDQKLARIARPENIQELIQKNVYKPEYRNVE
ncbi:MAG TPA: malic enzyme-like NAD(P)-binding protein, partial [Waddliaceae bacterium]